MNQLAISSLAWPQGRDSDAADVLNQTGCDVIDVAPCKHLNLETAKSKEIREFQHFWSDRGIWVRGFQGIFFGLEGLNIFSKSDHCALLHRIEQTLNLSTNPECAHIVFGAPKNRLPPVGQENVEGEALRFFERAGDLAAAYGSLIAIEHVPAEYGCQFLTTFRETIKFATKVGHPSVGIQLDIGNLELSGEDLGEALLLLDNALIRFEIHISDNGLRTFGVNAELHRKAASLLKNKVNGKYLTIEAIQNGELWTREALSGLIMAGKELYL